MSWIFALPSWLGPLVLASAATLFVVVVVGNAVRPKYRRLYGRTAPLYALWNALLPSVWVQAYLWLALVVLWLPAWWAATALSHSVGVGTPTTWFVAAVVGFYGTWLVRGFLGLGVNRAFVARAALDDAPAPVRRRVAVIGAGMAGLVAAKELREEGHDVVVYERAARPGGVWAASKARGGNAWGSTMTSTGALNTMLSDAVTEVFHPEHQRFPHHLDRAQFLGLLERYERRHRVFDGVLRCGVDVEELRALPGDRWELQVRDTRTGTRSLEAFDAVAICTGLNDVPSTPTIEGQDRFVGAQLHAQDLRPDDPVRHAGRRVLVVGMGETASDVVKDLVDAGAAHVHVSQRGPTWVIPRDVANVPADHVESRLVHDGPMVHRWAMLLTGVAPFALWPLLRHRRVRTHRFGHVFRILVRNHPRKWELWRLGSINWTKSDNLYDALESGRATVHRDVARLEERAVVFADGSRHAVDTVVYCTGYRPGPSLLPPVPSSDREAVLPAVPRSSRDLYKLTIPPDHPNVAILGYARGQIGSITLSTELQARWWALVVSGKRSLPSRDEMRRHAVALRHHGRRFHQPTRTTPCFAYSIARAEIGCEPDLFELFRTDRRLWFAVLMGPICAAHFRLRGPHARPDVARAQLTMPQAVQSDDYVDSVDLLTSTLPLAALVVPLYGAWSRLLPGFLARNATRSYI